MGRGRSGGGDDGGQFPAVCGTEGAAALSLDQGLFKVGGIIMSGKPFNISLDIPNEETKEAIEEVRQMKRNPSFGKAYTDVDEMIRELQRYEKRGIICAHQRKI